MGSISDVAMVIVDFDPLAATCICLLRKRGDLIRLKYLHKAGRQQTFTSSFLSSTGRSDSATNTHTHSRTSAVALEYTARRTVCGVSFCCIYKYIWLGSCRMKLYQLWLVQQSVYVDLGCSIFILFFCFFYHLFSLRSNSSSALTKSSCNSCSSGHGVANLGRAAFTSMSSRFS